MKILNTHIHKLRLYIDKDAPLEYKIRWDEFKTHCESGEDENKNIVEQIIYKNCLIYHLLYQLHLIK